MTRWVRFGTLAVMVSVMTAAAFAGDVTVGRFYSELARARQLPSGDAATAEGSLRSAGFGFPKLALDKSLTEGDMTSIANTLGLMVTTARASQTVSELQLSSFMAGFGSQIAGPAIRGGTPVQIESKDGDPGNSGNGKGKKKGHQKSTSEPG